MGKKKKIEAEIRIVILQRGWVAVGRYHRRGGYVRLTDAAVVRRWGTTKGLGELAARGPMPDTILDFCPPLEFHVLTEVFSMECCQERWDTALSYSGMV
jgi:hypothetical protein